MGPLAASGVPVLAGIPAVAQDGHEHGIDVPVLIGPLALRVVLLAAVLTVAGFAMMRAFLGEPGRTTTLTVSVSAAVAVVFEFLLAGPLDFPARAAVLVLAALAVPIYLAAAGPGRAPVLTRCAPWMVTLTAVLAFVEFTRALLGTWEPGALARVLHTGLVLALVGLSWSTVGLPRSRVANATVLVMAAVLALAAVAGTGYASTLRPPSAPAAQATAVKIANSTSPTDHRQCSTDRDSTHISISSRSHQCSTGLPCVAIKHLPCFT